MHNRSRNAASILTMACFLGLQAITPSLSFAQHTYPSTGHRVTLTTVEEGSHKLLRVSVNSGFEAYDNSQLAERTPLILIHGIGGTDSRLFHWENFLEYAAKKPGFLAKYKIYLYHYDSTKSVPNISHDLQTTLKGFVGALGGRKIKILAYSEGGLLTRNALQDAYLDDHTEEVLTIATPFHGSPLANPEWIQAQVKTDSPFSLVRMFQNLAYKITGRKYPSFRQDFHWDNFDGAIPMDQYVKNNGPMVATDYALAKKHNFVTYGSYFGLEVDPSVVPRELELKAVLPKEHAMPGNLLRKNFLFSLVRNNIGNLPLANKLIPHAKDVAAEPVSAEQSVPAVSGMETVKMTTTAMVSTAKSTASQDATLLLALAKSGEPAAVSSGTSVVPVLKGTASAKLTIQPVSMMMFNDGISPISSTLWLGRYAKGVNGASIPVDKLWSTLKSLKGNKNVRLFAGLDHRNWMDGTTRTGEEQIRDLLNPDEPPRTVFEWIVYDLMS